MIALRGQRPVRSASKDVYPPGGARSRAPERAHTQRLRWARAVGLGSAWLVLRCTAACGVDEFSGEQAQDSGIASDAGADANDGGQAGDGGTNPSGSLVQPQGQFECDLNLRCNVGDVCCMPQNSGGGDRFCLSDGGVPADPRACQPPNPKFATTCGNSNHCPAGSSCCKFSEGGRDYGACLTECAPQNEICNKRNETCRLGGTCGVENILPGFGTCI